MNTRKCPICEADSNQILFTQIYSKTIKHRIVCCNNCGFVFVKNAKPQTFYNWYYKDMSKYEDTRDQKLHEKSVEIIARHADNTDHILDMGCSTGHLLYLLKIKVKTNSIDSFKAEEKYDFIILSTVLEHLSELRKSIKKINTLLSNDGM